MEKSEAQPPTYFSEEGAPGGHVEKATQWEVWERGA